MKVLKGDIRTLFAIMVCVAMIIVFGVCSVMSESAGIVPFYSEGEPGLWPGYNPDTIEPIPGPPTDVEKRGTKAKPFPITSEKVLDPDFTVKGVQPGPPLNAPELPAGAQTDHESRIPGLYKKCWA